MLEMKGSIIFRVTIIIIVSFIMGIPSAGCNKKAATDEPNYTGPFLDNVLAGIKEKNYTKFSMDFSDQLKTSLTEQNFNTLVSLLNSKIGDYQGKTFSSQTSMQTNTGNRTTVVYKAKYTKETQDVLITITFSDIQEKKIIEVLMFDSPNLRKQ